MTPRIVVTGNLRLCVLVIRGVTVDNLESITELLKGLTMPFKEQFGKTNQGMYCNVLVLSQIVYLTILEKGYSRQSCPLPAIADVGNRFSIPNISANSKLETKSFQTFVRSLCRIDLYKKIE
jgi:hypothetical protein